MAHRERPVVALAIGDAAGIGPELAAAVVADPQVRPATDLLVVGDIRVLEAGARVRGLSLPEMRLVREAPPRPVDGRPVFLDLAHLDPETVEPGRVQAGSGRFALANFRTALDLARDGLADAVAFTPFNKGAMRLAEDDYEDEIVLSARHLQTLDPTGEFNVLPGLWNARVTSHVPLSAVAGLLTREAILETLSMTDRAMRAAGFDPPRIAVAAVNPHAGDNGNFGTEEGEVIGPAVAAARTRGIVCEGPFPSDTVFVRARRGDFDGVVTMYHDQGQIAMKLIGFDAGVTLLGGFQFPIATPAHGSAYDIAGKGIADTGASRNAVLLAARMARPAPGLGGG